MNAIPVNIELLKEVTKDKYFEMLEVLPPIYISKIEADTGTVEILKGFAVSEPYTENSKGLVFSVFFYNINHKYYEVFCNVKTPSGAYVLESYDAMFGKGYTAEIANIKFRN